MKMTTFDKICEHYGLDYHSASVIKALSAAYQLGKKEGKQEDKSIKIPIKKI